MERCKDCGSKNILEINDTTEEDGTTTVGYLCMNCGIRFKIRPTSFPPQVQVIK